MSSNNAVIEQVTAMASAYGDVATRVGELERKMARPAFDNDNHASSERPTLGSLVANDRAVKNLTSDFRGSAIVRLERSAITTGTSTVGTATSTSSSLLQSQRLPGIVTPVERPFTVRDLIDTARTTAGSVEYAKEVGFTNNAAPVAEGASKPYSDITFSLETAPVRTIAHLFKASRQVLDDTPALAAHIDARARYGLELVEERQIFFGSGTGQNIKGLVPQATLYQTSRTAAADQDLDILLHAISQSEEADLPASGIVMSVRDWRRLLGIKDLGGNYLSGGPFGTTAPRIWDLPVYPTNTFATGQFLVGAFASGGAQIFDRMDIEVLVSSENDKDFEQNLFTIRAEERLTLATYRPEAFVVGTFKA